MKRILWFSIVFLCTGIMGISITTHIKYTTHDLSDWHFNALITFFTWKLIISAIMVVLSLMNGKSKKIDNKKELTTGKILFRILAYPISIVIITYFIIYAFAYLLSGPFSSFSGGYFLGIFIVFLGAAFYLFSDILILTSTGKKEGKRDNEK